MTHQATVFGIRGALAIAVLLIASLAPHPASANDPYRWCAIYMGGDLGGTTSCYFHTEEQCRASLGGIGGFCRQNFSYSGPDTPQLRRHLRR